MKAMGFEGFERGERGSTREHLSDLEYKTMKESERLAEKKKESTILDEGITEKENSVAELSAKIYKQETAVIKNEKHLADLDKKIKASQGKVLSVKQIEKIPVKISRPVFGKAEDETATILKSDWENVKKTALTQAKTDEEYRTTKNENTAFKKENSKLYSEKEELENEVARLRKDLKGDVMARATKNAELHNLKNDVAKIPQDVWNAYTKPKTQQKSHQQEQGGR